MIRALRGYALPHDSPSRGLLDPLSTHALAVKDGIDEMLEQLNLTDDEREALEGDREAVTALAERLADTPPPPAPLPGTSERPAPSSH